MPRIEVVTDLHTITCYKTDCGILFAVPTLWLANKQRDHSDFTCPNGHSQAFLWKSKEEELREQLKRERESVEYHRKYSARLEGEKTALKHQVRAQKGVATKLKRKAAIGVCGFCEHSFPDVAAHVAQEHPSEVVESQAEDDA